MSNPESLIPLLVMEPLEDVDPSSTIVVTILGGSSEWAQKQAYFTVPPGWHYTKLTSRRAKDRTMIRTYEFHLGSYGD